MHTKHLEIKSMLTKNFKFHGMAKDTFKKVRLGNILSCTVSLKASEGCHLEKQGNNPQRGNNGIQETRV